MKKIVKIILLAGCVTTYANAQTIKADKVPVQVKNAFAKMHPATKVVWEKEKGNFEAGFTLSGKETSELYAANGALLETEIEIKSSELPTAVLAKLKGKKIAEAAKITKADGVVIY